MEGRMEGRNEGRMKKRIEGTKKIMTPQKQKGRSSDMFCGIIIAVYIRIITK